MSDKPIILTPPVDPGTVSTLKAGDRILITGSIYTARDAAHRRMIELIERGETLPVELEGAVLYYVGPTPSSPGRPTGSAGPTTSSRVDRYTPELLARGLRVVIGKGDRSPEVAAALQEHGAVYLAAVGGAGALLAERVASAEVVAWPELGTEAIHHFEVNGFPAIVVMDAHGGNLYQSGRARYRRQP
ncbi:MAG: fumarate hydratase C-terminal domain-containing protein [Actinobacteria bacterium]|nr:fumarate hydratase C-terminal domain-containing protein [Actinomycetota bacterium]